MTKNLYFIFAGMCLILLFFAGCSNKRTVGEGNSYSSTEKEENISASTSIQKLTEDSINERYDEADDICFEDYKSIDNLNYLAFSYKNNQAQYYGFTVAEQDDEEWKISYFEDYANDQNESVMITQFIGTYPGTEDRKFHITSGYVNDKQVNQVILYYPESKVDIIQLGENQQGFLDININSDDSLLKIECKSGDEKILYHKEFN